MPKDLEVPSETIHWSKPTIVARAIAVVALDTAMGIALILLACFVAVQLRQAIPVDYPDLYMIWFAFGMIPFVLFAHWRGALRLTWRAVTVVTPLLLVWPFVPMAAFDGPRGSILYLAVLLGLLWLGDRLSARCLSGNSQSEHRTK